MIDGGITTEIVSAVDDFRKLESEWDSLLEQSDQRTFFLRWSWNWLWWSYFAPADSQLHIVCCRGRGGTLLGIAPFYTLSRQVLPGLRIRELALIGMSIHLKTSEYVDLFAARGKEHAVGEAVAAALERDGKWDQLSLLRVPAESLVAGAFMQRMGSQGRSSVCDRAHQIDTSAGWQHYKQGLGRSMRRNVEYYGRRLAKRHACEFALAQTPDVLAPAIDDFVRLHQARWRAAGEPGIFSRPTVCEFVKAAIWQNLPQDRVRLWTLKLDGRVEAALLGFLDNGVLHYFQKGFNPSFLDDDIGTAMLAHCIRACCDDEGIRVFDFMGGGAKYKAMWATHERATTLHEVRRRNFRTSADAALQGAWIAARTTYRWMVPQQLREFRREWLKRKRFVAATKASWLLSFVGDPWSVLPDVMSVSVSLIF
jgi:CelD/BcsL family acetyltransferase involved in cellulose biosynthesis